MKAFLCIFSLIWLLSCQKVDPNGRVEAAFITDNSLIADGCEEHVALVAKDSTGVNPIIYKPTAATLPLYHYALKTIPPTSNGTLIAVTVRFVETGRQVELLCGWGQKPKVGEITILEIKPR